MRPAELARRFRPFIVAYYLQKDLRARLAQRNGGAAPIKVHTDGRERSVEKAVATAREAFAAMWSYAGLEPSAVAGRRTLELGPGDDLGLCLLALAHGASEAVALDRFAVARDSARAEQLRAAITDRSPDALTVIEGTGIEDAADRFGNASFDLIYSVAVLEHVGDLDAAFRSMARMLRPGGLMIHFVGGGDHGMFSSGSHHPLTYLEIPERLYRLMTEHSGGPNRVLPSTLRRHAEVHDWEWTLKVTHVIGAPHLAPDELVEQIDIRDFPEQLALVESIRGRLSRPFRDLPASELVVDGTFVVARMPGGAG